MITLRLLHPIAVDQRLVAALELRPGAPALPQAPDGVVDAATVRGALAARTGLAPGVVDALHPFDLAVLLHLASREPAPAAKPALFADPPQKKRRA